MDQGTTTAPTKLTLLGSVSLGTGVMIGAGIFVLMGQVAELVGGLFPLAFLAGAVVSGLSAYTYVKFASAYPSSGGVAMFLRRSYGPGTLTGTFALLMYVSMVIAESLVARTFGAYSLRLVNIESTSVLVPVLGVSLLAVAFVVNLAGNKVIEATANVTAAVKIFGIAVLAIAGLWVGAIPSLSGPVGATTLAQNGLVPFAGALALSILAFKGFTTITNQGGDILNPTRNLGRSIVLSLVICAVIYVALALSVAANLSIEEIVQAKDYALAEAARPVFGDWGLGFTVVLAVVATVSGVFASVFSASRLLGMLSNMKQVPALGSRVRNPALLFTVVLAITLTSLFDLTRIAAIGAIFYLTMDIAIHWGLLRYLRGQLDFNPAFPVIALVVDVAVLSSFLVLKYETDPLVLVVSAVGFLAVLLAERFFMRTHTDSDGSMHMGMD
jgi:amino acid transporter